MTYCMDIVLTLLILICFLSNAQCLDVPAALKNKPLDDPNLQMAFVLITILSVLSLSYGEELLHKGPTRAYATYTVQDCLPSLKIVDDFNICWYWECVNIGWDKYTLIPRQCALGTRVPYTFEADFSNPCSDAIHGRVNYDCSREQDTNPNVVPDCFNELKCQNGGVLRHAHGNCWCDCSLIWQGEFDCSRPTGKPVFDIGTFFNGICTNGQPDRDYCSEAGGCLNGGKCYNMCRGFWCDCPSPYRFGARCEAFSCDGENECLNGGICTRGYDNKDEARSCQCPPGYKGYKCQHSVNVGTLLGTRN